MTRIRVAALQYLIRPFSGFHEFAEQVTALVETAADYDCDLLVFPEYFTVQLLTAERERRAVDRQIRHLTQYVPQYVALMQDLAETYAIHIVGGTIPVADPEDDDRIYNDCYVFGPDRHYGVQGKLHMTRAEKEEWFCSPRSSLKIFETPFGRLGVTVCYDVEFPEIARAIARAGANLLIVPSQTDERQGFLRVRYCAHARAIENQMYVVHTSTVGSLPKTPAISLNYGQASILTPSDFPFARDGILAEGTPNQEMMILGELDMEVIDESRERGTVLPLNDSKRTAELVMDPEVVQL
jgi:predicted amidohydrolase